MDSLIIQYILAPVIIAIITWVLARRKHENDVKKQEIDNVGRITEIWRELSEELQKKLNSANDEIERLKSINNKHEKRISELEKIINEFKNGN